LNIINVENNNAYPRKSTTIFITFFKIDFFIFFLYEENYKKSQFSKEERHARTPSRIHIVFKSLLNCAFEAGKVSLTSSKH
jgi:hypothetical protein